MRTESIDYLIRTFLRYYNKAKGRHGTLWGERFKSVIVEKGDEGETMALKEGLVNVESPEGAFEIHQKKEQRDLDAFKAEMEQGVKDMKKEGDAFIKQEKDDYVAFKK
ncbi:MAG: hypothetical protein KKD44_17135, partial [Proteobacteria bacterium]|nr:hypothetical protein [Pseudomonadota bacterium]